MITSKLSLCEYNMVLWNRVESGSDDPDNLGHLGNFLEGQVGLIHKLNYLDVTWTSHVLQKTVLASSKWVTFGSDECTKISLVWNQLIISSCFEACGVQRFHLQEVCARDQFRILPRMKKSVALFHIKNFSCHVTLLLKRKLQHVGHKWVIFGLFCGSVGQMG